MDPRVSPGFRSPHSQASFVVTAVA